MHECRHSLILQQNDIPTTVYRPKQVSLVSQADPQALSSCESGSACIWLVRLESPSCSGWELLVLVMQSASLQKIQLEGDNDQIKCKVCNENSVPSFIMKILSCLHIRYVHAQLLRHHFQCMLI